DVPMTARKRVVRSLRRSSSVSFSRPKKRCSWSASNGRSPGNGLDSSTGLQAIDEGAERTDVASVPLRHDGRFVRAEVFLLGRARPDHADRHPRLRLRAAVARRLLQLAQLAAQPQLVAGAEEDHDA